MESICAVLGSGSRGGGGSMPLGDKAAFLAAGDSQLTGRLSTPSLGFR